MSDTRHHLDNLLSWIAERFPEAHRYSGPVQDASEFLVELDEISQGEEMQPPLLTGKVRVMFSPHAQERIDQRVKPIIGNGHVGFVKRIARRGMNDRTAAPGFDGRWMSVSESSGYRWTIVWVPRGGDTILIVTVIRKEIEG